MEGDNNMADIINEEHKDTEIKKDFFDYTGTSTSPNRGGVVPQAGTPSGPERVTPDLKVTQKPLVDPFLYNPGLSYGVSGFRRASGWIYNDYTVELSDPIKLPWIWRSMRESDAAIASMLYAVESLAGGVSWHVEPGRSGEKNEEGQSTETPMDRAAAEFLESVIEDIGQPWQSVVTDLLSCCTYGWSVNEVTYKLRKGNTNNPNVFNSKYNDGRVGWGKISPIAQTTRWSWIFNEDKDSPRFNEAVAVEQFAAPLWQRRHIPLDKCIHCTFKPFMGNPEGWSPLRAIYAIYRYSQKIQLLMAQGIDRDLIGYPVVYIPEEVIIGQASGDPAYCTIYERFVNLATKTRRDDAEGIVLPSSVYMDAEGRPTSVPKYRFELLTSGGSRQFNLVEVLNMLETWILSTLASDLLSLGHNGTGSFALADVKNESMKRGIESLLDRIQESVNDQAIRKLFQLNPEFEISDLPKLVHDGITERDTVGLADYLVKIKQAGIPIPLDKGMLKFILEQANIPIPSEDAMDKTIALAEQMATQPTNQFQMAYSPGDLDKSKNVNKASDSIKNEMDNSDDIIEALKEFGIFDEDESRYQKIDDVKEIKEIIV